MPVPTHRRVGPALGDRGGQDVPMYQPWVKVVALLLLAIAALWGLSRLF